MIKQINQATFEEAREIAETRPIIRSFLDLDHYKLTMGQFAFHRYPDVPVKYASKNRTKKVRSCTRVKAY